MPTLRQLSVSTEADRISPACSHTYQRWMHMGPLLHKHPPPRLLGEQIISPVCCSECINKDSNRTNQFYLYCPEETGEWPHRCHSPVSGHKLKDVQRFITKYSQNLEKKTCIKGKVYFNLVEYDLLPTDLVSRTWHRPLQLGASSPVEQASGGEELTTPLLPSWAKELVSIMAACCLCKPSSRFLERQIDAHSL